MKRGDVFLLLVVLMISGGLWVGAIYMSRDNTNEKDGQGNDYYVVYIRGLEVHRASLDYSANPQYIEIPLRIGNDSQTEVTVELVNGKVRIMPMSLDLCPKQICCHVFGPINRPGSSIVCLPNETILRIESDRNLGYDALTS